MREAAPRAPVCTRALSTPRISLAVLKTTILVHVRCTGSAVRGVCGTGGYWEGAYRVGTGRVLYRVLPTLPVPGIAPHRYIGIARAQPGLIPAFLRPPRHSRPHPRPSAHLGSSHSDMALAAK